MSRVERLRRGVVVAAAGAAALGGVEVVGITHGHRWLAFVFIGLQVLLIVEALLLLARLKKVKADER
jgi:uncharacterized membrane protein